MPLYLQNLRFLIKPTSLNLIIHRDLKLVQISGELLALSRLYSVLVNRVAAERVQAIVFCVKENQFVLWAVAGQLE